MSQSRDDAKSSGLFDKSHESIPSVDTESFALRRSCPSCALDLPFSVRVCPNDGTDLLLSSDSLFADKYELLEEIGQGAIGTIYKARHIALDSLVAIKVLNQVTEDTVTFLRFQREAKAASKISHPNVINVFDFGIWEDHQPYMVMDYLEGDTLDRVVKKKNRITLLEVVDIILPVAKGLAHAHASGILHRDLKPSNIMILNDGDAAGRVKILDFGLAKLLFRDDGVSLSATGAILGSPAYMSPEQAKGSTVDGRTDIYSLACIVFQLITGEPPLMGDSAPETFMKRLNQDAPLLSSFVEGKIPVQLDSLISRMLERDPNKRLKSSAFVHQELLSIRQLILEMPQEPIRLKPDLKTKMTAELKATASPKQFSRTVVDVKSIAQIHSADRIEVADRDNDFALSQEVDSIEANQDNPISLLGSLKEFAQAALEEFYTIYTRQSTALKGTLVLALVLVLILVIRIAFQ